MKVSIITVTKNSARTIEDSLLSVLKQDYSDIEHIVIDGDSSDGTQTILQKYRYNIDRIISEPDNGIYDAMNKGIHTSSGEIIGILNSDDIYAYDAVISDVVEIFQDESIDVVYGDLWYVRTDDVNKIVRRFRSSDFKPEKLKYGIAPAHPTMFIRKSIFDKFGLYNDSYSISADFEFIVRIFKDGEISAHYLPKVMTKMRMGGISTRNWQSLTLSNSEMLRACRENNIQTNMFNIVSKYLWKSLGYIHK